MKVLITGGAGFIGSHVGRQLLDAGHQVTIVDNLSRGHLDAVDSRAHFVQADLADVETLTHALAGHDAVIHMAALIEVSESVSDPLLFAQNNIVNSVRLAEAMRSAGVKKIVFSSSATVYGVPKRLPILEDDPTIAFNPYGATKLAMEACLSAYHFSFGFDVILLRYFNPYGPGERHQPETHAIPNFIRAALEGRPIPLYWKGEQVRDFIYIDDLAAAPYPGAGTVRPPGVQRWHRERGQDHRRGQSDRAYLGQKSANRGPRRARRRRAGELRLLPQDQPRRRLAAAGRPRRGFAPHDRVLQPAISGYSQLKPPRCRSNASAMPMAAAEAINGIVLSPKRTSAIAAPTRISPVGRSTTADRVSKTPAPTIVPITAAFVPLRNARAISDPRIRSR